MVMQRLKQIPKKEALELTHDMEDSDFDWSDFDNEQVVEEIDY